jgi:hypothetical protein
VAILALGLPALLATTASPAAAATLPPVSLIGDSTLLGMTTSSKAIISASYNMLFDARSCRRLVMTSCRGRDHLVPPNTLTTMRADTGRLGDALVIMAGYDDWTGFASAVDTIVGEAQHQGLGHVIWLTYRTQGPYVGIGGAYSATYRAFNATLYAKALQHPELTIADWDGYSLGQSSWFAPDGIHLTASGATALGGFLKAQLDKLGLQRCYVPVTGTPTAPPAAVPITQSAPGSYTPKALRVLDTRPGQADPVSIPIGAGRSIELPLVANGQVPAGTTSVMVNLTAVSACGAGFLTAYPCGAQVPFASNLNVPIRRTRAAMAAVMLNAQGQLCVYSSITTDVLVDLLGAFGPTGQKLNPIAPERLLDTRNGFGARYKYVGRIGVTPFAVPVAGGGAVPAGATAVLVNVTAVGPDTDGFLSVSACGATPGSSNLNFRGGQVLANLAVTALDSAGRACFTSSTKTNLIVDVLGWFGATGLRLQAQTPQRVVDTRNGIGGVVGPLPARGTVSTPVANLGMLATVTAVQTPGPGYLTAYPCGPLPNASNLNYAAYDVIANLAVVPPGQGAKACVMTSAGGQVLIDKAGTLVN